MSGSTNDQSYGQTAVSLGFLSETQVQECLQIQKTLRSMGLEEPLGELLAKKGFITPQQHTQVLKKMGIQSSPIPGYTILGKIGQGGMGTVYKAVQASVNRTVAIKILAASATRDKTYVARFLQEAQAAAALNHKNLISAIDVGVSNGINYFIMEYVTGKSCRELLNAKGPFGESDALSVAMQMAEVLQHIHEHRMVHRDIKPENIMLTAERQVKLCDLGLAKSTVSEEQSLTQEGLTVGTPYFMSPEQIRGDKDVDIRADLYSLGATIFFLVTGRYPFEGKSAAETMSRHLNQPVPDPRKVKADLSEDLALVVQKLMAKDRAQRYQTPADLLEDLQRIEKGSTPALARQHAARAHAMRTQRRLAQKAGPKWPVAAAASLVLLGGGSVFIFRKPPPPPEPPKTVVVHVPAPAAVVEGPKKPADPPAKVAEAASLYSTADQMIKADRWKDALTALKRLTDGYAGLAYTRDRMAEIGEMRGLCEGRLKAADSAHVKSLAEAEAAFGEGRWAEAMAGYQTLVKAGHAASQARVDACRRELGAATLVKEIQKALDAGAWLDVIAKTSALQQQDRAQPLATMERHRGELNAGFIKARVEIDASKDLAAIHAAAAAADWTEVAKTLPAYEKFRDTDTYRQKGGELDDLRGRLMKANEAAAESTAQQAWVNTLELYSGFMQDKKYDDAEEAMRSYQRAYGASRIGRQREAELQGKLGEVAKRRKADHDEEGKKLWAQIQKEFKAQQFESASENLVRMTEEFGDTPAAKGAAGTIKQYRSYLDTVVRPRELLITELGFDDLPGQWMTRGGAEARNSNEDPYHGRRSARITLPADGSANHPLSGVTASAEHLTFYARSRGSSKSLKVRLGVWENTPAGNTATWILDVSLTPEWQKQTLRLADFRPYSQTALNRGRMDPRQLYAVVFYGPNDGSLQEFQVDVMRVEGGRLSK
jgi:hypothetical protein